MKTTLHTYCFDTRNEEEKAAYKGLVKSLTAQGLKCFRSWGGGDGHYTPFAKLSSKGIAVELETAHIFENQWNTAPIGGLSDKGYRVFDWAEDYLDNKQLKRGHYLTQTPEMADIRRNTVACGYCAKQEPAQKGHVFCPHCAGSEYLTVDKLHLTRMLPVDTKQDRADLTDAERAHLLPIYKDAQLHGQGKHGLAKLKAARERVESDHKKAIHKAETEHKGFVWLLDKGFSIENVIYYGHTDKFSFGWRSPVDTILLSDLLDILSEFPFTYEIKCADGRTLSGE